VGQAQKRILKTKEPSMTTTSYRAVQASKPGRLEVVERELTAPPPGKVRIRVEACGVCHSDSGTSVAAARLSSPFSDETKKAGDEERETIRRDEARAALAAVYGTFTQGFTTPDLVEAAARLKHESVGMHRFPETFSLQPAPL
jgi:hypothetical protein